GHMRTALMPSAKFFTGATMGTGPTPAVRWFFPRAAGFGTGVAAGALHDPWVDPFGLSGLEPAAVGRDRTSLLEPGSSPCPGGCHTPTGGTPGTAEPPIIFVNRPSETQGILGRPDVGDFPLPTGDTRPV
ncbi:MAG TPA: hypothetical protein VHE80_10845, partial [Acidimicrobiales bacterium]|nr:hypothetical protein [Acidimicrobiales bacterium]